MISATFALITRVVCSGFIDVGPILLLQITSENFCTVGSYFSMNQHFPMTYSYELPPRTALSKFCTRPIGHGG